MDDIIKHQGGIRLATLAASVLMIAACGGGGGGGGGGSTGGGGTPPSRTLGIREVPGYTVQVERLEDVVPGQPLPVQITCVGAADQPAVAAVESWLATSYDADRIATSATPVGGVADAWTATIAVSDPLPQSIALWVRLTLQDGSILEAGQDAFQLQGP